MKLYEITGQLAALADGLGEEVPADLELQLDALSLALEEKAAGCVKVWRTLEAEADGFRGESQRLAKMAGVRESAAARLKAYVARCLDAAGIAKLPSDVGKLSVRTASRPTIRWAGDGELPTEFARIETKLDYEKAAAAFKAGTLPDGFNASQSRFVQVI